MKFTVVIPTFKRPKLLRDALKSVQAQTARRLIDKVIVSENGLDRASEILCKEFSDLPIEYIYQQDQLAVQKHMQWLMSQEKSNYVALLCDDDWWDIHHLAMAAESLSTCQNCVSYFSNFAYVASQSSFKKQIYYNGVEVLHLGIDNFCNYKPIVYKRDNIFLFSLLITPFHYSSMVCKGDVLMESVKIFDDVHPTYADRLLYAVISMHGNIIFNPLKTAIILYHQTMDSHNYDSNEWTIERQNGSIKLLQVADDNRIDLRNLLNKVYTASDDDDKKFIVAELIGTFPDRSNLSWFVGLDAVLEHDENKHTGKNIRVGLKVRVAERVINLIRKMVK